MRRAAGRPALRLVGGGRRSLRVAVLGGGVAGLASAHFLAKAGHSPVVFEAARELGGLGAHFEHLGVSLDRWYHVLLETDTELLALISELGLADDLRWRPTSMAVLLDGRLSAVDTPLDLLRLAGLSRPDRIRTGLAALCARRLSRGDDLDMVRAVDWLPGVFGPEVFARLWEPLLRARFGVRWSEVPAHWAWSLLRRGRDGARRMKGHLRGGCRALASALHATVIRRGGQVRLGSPVHCVDETHDGTVVTTAAGAERYDAVVSTIPSSLLPRIVAGDLATALPPAERDRQGVVNAVIVSRHRLERFYGTVVMDPRFPFQCIVETTRVIPPEWVEGRHLYYLMNRCDGGSDVYQRSDDVVAGQAVEGLATLYPNFRRREVEAVYIFRAPHIEPVRTVGSQRSRPAPRVARSRLYLCTTAQTYPRIPAWNASVAQAVETVTCILDDLTSTGAATG